jgi:hypothetical protein
MVPVAIVALREHGGDHVVSARQIVDQIRGEVALAGFLPEMMVRIDDGERGFQYLLRAKREPTRVRIGISISSRDL